MNENKKILVWCIAVFVTLALFVNVGTACAAETNLTVSSVEQQTNINMKKLMKQDGYTDMLKWEMKLVSTKCAFIKTTDKYIKTWKKYLSSKQQKKLINNRNKVIQSHSLKTISKYKNNSAAIIKKAKELKVQRAAALAEINQMISKYKPAFNDSQLAIMKGYRTKINKSYTIKTIQKIYQQARDYLWNVAGIPDINTEGWSAEKIQFVRDWGNRNNNYLAGYPMEGMGYVIAKVSYECNVDPRHCAAVACLESGKGRVCFRPYNAWGWMAATNWESWEQSITEYIAAFGNKYGYCFTYDSCLLYSGGNPNYYYLVQEQMSLI